ncbi:hypothetical protein BJG93_00710 [Paraburkholderia sprentiae WSM5005]|uniref:Uncharacterized protein n=1 Tax=Paraburkholderia sprentiae WSM5005 TaxID=754502 RepID=A0A1I9YCQ5_9BURK|nr:hypothetical protein [Paraburkholderia sprentiae]APA84088.2 hypothetical protein BJG93_00710 [Paraburkholderia sprentiae WSM5005]
MKVCELVALLQGVDPHSTVLFLEDYSDLSETDEILDVIVPDQPWTYETGRCGRELYSVRYPETFEQRSEADGYRDVVHTAERVVLLVNGVSNFRRMSLPERPHR